MLGEDTDDNALDATVVDTLKDQSVRTSRPFSLILD
jgi:hypothetical protein